jgi:hypothetical protein
MSTRANATEPKFDERQWRAVVVTPPTQALVDAAFEKYLADVARYYERGQPFGPVFDIRHAAPLNATQRRRIDEEIDHQARDCPTIRVVQSIVIASAVQRGIVSVITWLSKQAVPTVVHATVDDAVAWAKEVRSAPANNQRAG